MGEYHSCFISHSTSDREFAEKLHRDLTENGVHCIRAEQELRVGERIRIALDRLIEESDKVILVLSRTSLNSDWVEKEVEKALEIERHSARRIVMPIRVDDVVMNDTTGWGADIRRTRNIGDFRSWRRQVKYSAALARLLRDLRRDDLI